MPNGNMLFHEPAKIGELYKAYRKDPASFDGIKGLSLYLLTPQQEEMAASLLSKSLAKTLGEGYDAFEGLIADKFGYKIFKEKRFLKFNIQYIFNDQRLSAWATILCLNGEVMKTENSLYSPLEPTEMVKWIKAGITGTVRSLTDIINGDVAKHYFK